jgi:uncharacterized protein YndB with AHSA1/START domain
MGNQSSDSGGSEEASRLTRARELFKHGVAGLIAWLKVAVKKDREVHYTREDQLTMAAIGHGLILGGVIFILLGTFDAGSTGHSLRYFYWCEIAIVAFGVIGTVSTRQVVGAVDKTAIDLDWAEEWMNERTTLKMQVQRTVLAAMFVLQFASMAALLAATGGPVDSPFAPMALGIGIFTPFILNKWWTVVFVILTTLLFYGLLTSIVGFSGSEYRPEPVAYAAVNLFILVLASIVTLRPRDALSFKLRKVVKARPERVWRAWTEESQVRHWIGEDPDPQVSLDVREGGTWQATIQGRNGTEATRWSGTYLEVEEPKRLVFSVAARSGIGSEVISVDLKQQGEITLMIVTQTDKGRFEGLKKGWSGFVDQLTYYVMSPVGRRSNGQGNG